MRIYRTGFINAFTRLEFVCVVVVIAVLLGIVIPTMGPTKARNARIGCVNNLRQVGISHRLFANDNGDRIPIQISTNEGGLKEVKETIPASRFFQALSNEIGTPKVLICHTDKARSPALSFEKLRNSNLSYFYNIDPGDEGSPQNILWGDRNITGGTMTNGLMIFSADSQFLWTSELHNKIGNVVISDGSIQQATSAKFREQFRAASNNVMRLAIP